ncbi:MAG: TonB-dependent receptor [Thermodesulfobacteriota bacterium]
MKKKIAFWLALTCLLPTVLSAKERKEPSAVPTLAPVIVTATKTEEKRQDIPNPVIIKDMLDIESSPVRSLGELLANEPGIDWRTRGDYGGAGEEIHMRGMAGDEVQVLVNGVSINSPSLGSADVSGMPLNNIERIEIVKGSGSLLYGSGAMAGTINILTKAPQRDRMDLSASAGYGTQGTYAVSAEQGMFVTDNVGYYLTAGRQETDGHRDNGDLSQNDVSLKLVYDKGDKLDVSLYGDYIDRDFGRPGIDPPPEAQPTNHFIGGVQFYDDASASLLDQGETKDGHAVLDIGSKPLKWLELNLKGYYTDMESYDCERYNAASWLTPAGAGMKTWVDNTITGAEGNLEFKPLEGASLLLGGDIKEHDWKTRQVDLDAGGADLSGETTNKAEIETKGMYAETQYRPHRFIKFLAGVRQENHSTFGTENLPLLGMILNPLNQTALKVTHGKHFKAPTPNDLFWPEDDFVRGNPDLKPQTGWHTDITVEQELLDEKLDLSFSYFNWNVEDKITWAENPNFPGPFGNKWTPTNVNKSRGNGWEAALKYDPVYAFGASLGYTHTNAEEETPFLTRNAQYVPEHLTKADVRYRSPFGLTATAVMRYTSRRDFYRSATDAVPSYTMDGYTTMDLRIDQRLLDNWLLALEASNLMDEEYDTYVGSFVDGGGTRHYGPFPGAGRSVYASVTYQY